MQISISRLTIGTLVAAALSACGSGGTGPGPGGGGDFGMSATIDGVAWTPSVPAGGAHAAPGAYNFSGLSTAGAGASISVSVSNIAGPGTYPIGVGPSGFGGTAIVTKGSAGWSTPLSGAAGSITITAISNTHMTGTFAFTSAAISGGAVGNSVVTSGVFDLPITTVGNPGNLPDNAGSRVTADVAGQPYNASTMAVTLPNDTTMISATSAGNNALGISIYGLHGTGTYALSSDPQHRLSYSTLVGSDFNLWGGVAGDSGSIVVTSQTASRIAGTYVVTLQPSFGPGATGPLHISGVFDLGLPQF